MFFTLSKVLIFLLDPLSWVLILLLIAWFSQYQKGKFIKLAVLIAYIFSNPFFANISMKLLEMPETSINKEYDIGIVLTGMMHPMTPSSGQIQFGFGVDRITEAMRLYKKGKIKKILITGGSGSIVYPEFRESTILAQFCAEFNIPESDILLETQSKNTYQNALFTAKILRQNNAINQEALLITSAFHMRRSAACFSKQGVNFATYPVDFNSDKIQFNIQDLIPNSDAIVTWKIIIKECVGYITYKLVGYL